MSVHKRPVVHVPPCAPGCSDRTGRPRRPLARPGLLHRVTLALLALLLWPSAPRADTTRDGPVLLSYMNRPVYTMRATIAGTSPAERAERALERLRRLTPEQLALPVQRSDLDWDGERVVSLRVGDTAVLTVFARDLDPDVPSSLADLSVQTQMRLQEALDVRRQMADPRRMARGAALSLAGLLVFLAVAWGTTRLSRRVRRRLEALIAHEAQEHRIFGIDWSDYALGVLKRVLQVSVTGLVLLWAYVALGHALRQFPATVPLADGMKRFIVRTMVDGLGLLWSALPGLGTILLIVLLARSVVWMLARLFDGVASGRLRIPGLHAETARATRRLAVFMVWGLALAAAYPLIPGSDSDVFRGLSVFIGFMLTLGSSGVVSQWMHGLVIVYSRALRVGDDVRIGTVEGRVTGLGALYVKVVDLSGDEITLPNGAVVTGSITNFTRQAGPGAVRGSVVLTVGYEVPGPQVQALLLEAAQRTSGLMAARTPAVLQRQLQNFAVEYELSVLLDARSNRAQTLSRLRESIRFVFDAAGVAVMSPQLVAQVAASPAGRTVSASVHPLEESQCAVRPPP